MDLSEMNVVATEGTDPNDPVEPKIKLSDSRKLKSGEYSKKHIEGIIKASKSVGIDPYQALALAWQESGFASAPPKKYRGRVINPSLAQIIDFEPAQEKELDEKAKSTGIDPMYLKLAITLRDKLKYGKQLGFKDEASQLQAYNGYGILTKRQMGGADKAYGVPIGEGINMKTNPLYGKRLLELKGDISKNKDISTIVSSVFGNEKPVSWGAATATAAYIQDQKLKKTAQETYKNSQVLKQPLPSVDKLVKK